MRYLLMEIDAGCRHFTASTWCEILCKLPFQIPESQLTYIKEKVTAGNIVPLRKNNKICLLYGTLRTTDFTTEEVQSIWKHMFSELKVRQNPLVGNNPIRRNS